MRTVRNHRNGGTSVEVLLVFAAFVVAVFVFLELGERVLSAYFVDGTRYIAIPIF